MDIALLSSPGCRVGTLLSIGGRYEVAELRRGTDLAARTRMEIVRKKWLVDGLAGRYQDE